MHKIRIIPCLDVKNGRVVKGINFLDLVDAGDPIEHANYYSNNGADEICFLDISASIEQRTTMIEVVKKTAEKVFIPLTVGGGIQSVENIKSLLKAGADKASINTAGILNKQLFKDSSDEFGSQCIVAAVDAKKHNNNWKVYSHGGTKDTGIDVIEWVEELQSLGVGEILPEPGYPTSINPSDSRSPVFLFSTLANSLANKSLTVPLIDLALRSHKRCSVRLALCEYEVGISRSCSITAPSWTSLVHLVMDPPSCILAISKSNRLISDSICS